VRTSRRGSGRPGGGNIDPYAVLVRIVSIGLWILLAAVGLAGAVAVVKAWRDGRFRGTDPAADDAALASTEDRLSSLDLGGAALGGRATLVHFSSAFCAPCRATRQVLARVEAAVDGVRHVEIDAESHLDLVRRLRITRTPTVLILDAEGRVRSRATGQPRRVDVLAALQVTRLSDRETSSHDADERQRPR
jgi:thiol-disulfide isomerase/thioredoxin